MKELTIKFEDKEYTTTDEKQIETYRKVVEQGAGHGIRCGDDNCPFSYKFCGLYPSCDYGNTTHTLKTISDYTLNFMELEEGKTYLREGHEDTKFILKPTGHIGRKHGGVVMAIIQKDRFKEYVPKMVSKTVERFVSDACITNIEECGFSTIDICKSENDVRKNKITITFGVED